MKKNLIKKLYGKNDVKNEISTCARGMLVIKCYFPTLAFRM